MKNIFFTTLLLLFTFSSFGQDDCKICIEFKKMVFERDSLIKKIAKVGKDVKALIKSNDEKAKIIKNLESKLQASNIIIKELIIKVDNYEKRKIEFNQIVQKLKKDSIILSENLLIHQQTIEKDKRERDDLEVFARSLQIKIDDLDRKTFRFWKENIPLNADSTFVVPYGDNGIKISYLKLSRNDFRLNTDNYSERFLNHLRWFLHTVKRGDITLMVKIYGRRRDEPDIVKGIERVLNSYLENGSYLHFFEPGESFVTFSFGQESSGKIGSSNR